MKIERHEVQERGIQPRKAVKGSHRMTAPQWPGEHRVRLGAGGMYWAAVEWWLQGDNGSVTGFENMNNY